ncbi:hypothetical protein SCHPADRAFT_868248 [Schizopora paradoxa]|uniref:THUMP domain-containing protein n=1 Tax=Schizopora paradoxa TaxID=27342 RepID=A0A0H2RZE0_9AGAM|nr:hypothetical protein SCHPADRAFT_868248 [Schizopora paradoxa]
MAEDESKRDKKRFRRDGTSVWTKRNIDGPGVWVSCVKGKEKATVGEVYALFESLAEELWPPGDEKSNNRDVGEVGGDDDDDEEDIEKAIAREVKSMKRPRHEQRFTNCETHTACLVFMSCKPPIDPTVLIHKHMSEVERTGITKTKFARRFVPVNGTCDANTPEITSLVQRLLPDSELGSEDKPISYKIDLRIRNHNVLEKDGLIQEMAKCIPKCHKVDLKVPDVVILAEVFKSFFTMSIVRDYMRFKKFNVMEVSLATNSASNARDTGPSDAKE